MNSDTKAKSRLSFNQIAPVLIPNSKAPASPAPIEMEIEIEMPVSQPPNASEEETPMDEKVFTDDNARERSRFWLGIVEKFRADEKDGEAMKLAELMDSYDLTRRRLTALFRKMDEDNGGSISKDEFRQGLETLGLVVTSDEDYNEMFSRVDTSGDGDIELEEFYQSMRFIRMAILMQKADPSEWTDEIDCLPGQNPRRPRMLVIDWNESSTSIRRPLVDREGQTLYFFGERSRDFAVRWILLNQPTSSIILKMGVKYRFHPVAIEDIFKIDDSTSIFKKYDSSSFLMLPMLHLVGNVAKSLESMDNAGSDEEGPVDTGVSLMKQAFIDYFYMRPKDDRYSEISDHILISNVALSISGPPSLDTVVLVQSGWRPLFPCVSKSDELDVSTPPIPPFDAFRRLIEKLRSPHMSCLKTGDSDWLVYYILEAIVDSYLPALDSIDALMDCMHHEIQSRVNKGMIVDISNLANMRRDLVIMGRILRPCEQVLSDYLQAQDHLSSEVRTFLREVRDRVRDIQASCSESYQRCLELLEQFRTLRDERMDVTLFRLTILTAVFVPAGLLSGIYGMNFVDENGDSSVPFMIGKDNWFYWLAVVLGLTVLTCMFFYKLRPRRVKIDRSKAVVKTLPVRTDSVDDI